MSVETLINYKDILTEIKTLSGTSKLVSKKRLVTLCKEVKSVLENEITSYRSCVSGAEWIPGGLIDFTAADDEDVIVVPDLHARKELIYKLLTYKPFSGSSTDVDYDVLDLLLQKKIKVIFLGDILHSEGQNKQRWLEAYEAYNEGILFSQAMNDEMADGISTLMQVMLLKKYFPQQVHCLKGNHENIRNETGNGNYPFHKFAEESTMVYDFMVKKYGASTVDLIAGFEQLLPVAAFLPNVIVSHAEPYDAYSKDDIINSVLEEKVVFGLTWTKNDEAQEGSVGTMLKNCTGHSSEKKYISGHRPVKGVYNLRQNGKLVQIHNPYKMQVALVHCETGFDPAKDIIEL